MANETELRRRLQRLSSLIRELEEAADPNVRSAAKDLVQLLMDIHSAALERMMDKVFQLGETGQRVIDDLGADPLVGSLLVLYGLHPDDLETRVARALQQVAPSLHSHSTGAELVSIEDADVRILASIGAHACGSTGKTVRALIEDAVYDAAPDVTSLVIEGLDGKPASGFVSLEKLLTNNPTGIVGANSLHDKTEVGAEQAAGD
jgi:Fe-S cluster biogenesis protein NfuA